MNIEDLKTKLKLGVVTVKFTKMNGELREMRCTLNDQFIPVTQETKEGVTKERKANPNVQAVWDIENDGWRSFRFDSITEFRV